MHIKVKFREKFNDSNNKQYYCFVKKQHNDGKLLYLNNDLHYSLIGQKVCGRIFVEI